MQNHSEFLANLNLREDEFLIKFVFSAEIPQAVQEAMSQVAPVQFEGEKVEMLGRWKQMDCKNGGGGVG